MVNNLRFKNLKNIKAIQHCQQASTIVTRHYINNDKQPSAMPQVWTTAFASRPRRPVVGWNLGGQTWKTWEEASTGEFQVEQLEYGIHIGGTRFTYGHLEFRFFYNFWYVTTTYMYLKVPVELLTILIQYPFGEDGIYSLWGPQSVMIMKAMELYRNWWNWSDRTSPVSNFVRDFELLSWDIMIYIYISYMFLSMTHKDKSI